MSFISTIALLFLSVSFSLGLPQTDTSTNCSADATPCGGPNPVCCVSGTTCIFRRGDPVCVNPNDPYSVGYTNGNACADPYLNSCDLVIRVPGFCCPIGDLCFNDGLDQTVSCVDAQGMTAPAYPSATTGIIPSATPVLASDSRITYNPSGAWNASNGANCSASDQIYATSTINSTISFNYMGPSIGITVVSAPNGGVFAVIVDGFNTSSTIDTNTGTALDGRPIPFCSPFQFPPFTTTPPDFASRDNHTIDLIFIGLGPGIPQDSTDQIMAQFNSFAIPDLPAMTESSNNHAVSERFRTGGILGPVLLVVLWNFM